MISFGTGFKCNSCMWEVNRDLEDGGAWEDCIKNYPPQTLVNPYLEMYGWVVDETLDTSKKEERVEEMRRSQLMQKPE